MFHSFQQLCDHLHINPNQETRQDQEKLSQWCHKHISRDVQLQGGFNGSYQQYINLAKKYFICNSKDIDENTAPNMNTLQYAAYEGYDRFITDLTEFQDNVLNRGSGGGDDALAPCRSSRKRTYSAGFDCQRC